MVNKTHGQLRQRGHTASAGPDLLTNHLLESLKGYLDNISASETQTVAKGVPLAELSASLAISVDTVIRQQQEIKRLYEQINDMKNICTQASSIVTMAGGVLVGDFSHAVWKLAVPLHTKIIHVTSTRKM